MAGIIDSIKLRVKQKDILTLLIVINVSVFLILNFIKIITTLFKLSGFDLVLNDVSLPANISLLLGHIWTIFTYMFVHIGFFHILFNMLMLYWFGQLYVSYFGRKSLGSLYILGGLAGAAIYVIAFNTIPYYRDMPQSYLIGGSASVMAIIFAAAFYRPDQKVGLLFIGQIKIIYIALAIFVIDFISLDGANSGGHVAHIGGAIIGYLFAKQYRKGTDITLWITAAIDKIANLVKRDSKTTMKVKYHKAESDYEYNNRRQKDTERIDHILDKIKSSGYSSLSSDEKKQLFDAGQK